MSTYPVTETPTQLQEMIDLLATLRNRFINVIYESMNLWSENNNEYSDGTTIEWKEMTRYEQASKYIAWMEERHKH